MSNDTPRVSLGMPVYNGENFIQQALDSILAQTFEDFELIISDNASTDRTEEICRAYAAKDRRIRYYRNEHNLGAGPNYNRVFELSNGQYFKWVAHDDLLTPDYVEKCVAVLDPDPSVIWCHSKTIFIDEDGAKVPFDPTEDCFIDKHGNFIRKHDPQRHLDSWKPHERYKEVLIATRWCFEVFGLIRLDALKQIMRVDALKRTELMGPYYGSDKVLLAELSLIGRYVEIPEPLFLRRCHAKQSSAPGSTTNWREEWIKRAIKREKDDAKTAARFVLPPRVVCVGGYLRAIIRAKLNVHERVFCLIALVRWLVKLENWYRFISEVGREKFNRSLPGRAL